MSTGRVVTLGLIIGLGLWAFGGGAACREQSTPKQSREQDEAKTRLLQMRKQADEAAAAKAAESANLTRPVPRPLTTMPASPPPVVPPVVPPVAPPASEPAGEAPPPT